MKNTVRIAVEDHPARYNVQYACALIPRIPGHYLAGELAERLAQWVRQACLAFGWRLERLTIRPEYILWICQTTPEISPASITKRMRRHTSGRIFLEFPHLVEENPSADFWAPGYLILAGSQPPGASVIREFLENTRRWQGVQDES